MSTDTAPTHEPVDTAHAAGILPVPDEAGGGSVFARRIFDPRTLQSLRGSCAFTVACVPTGMNSGVSTSL